MFSEDVVRKLLLSYGTILV